MNPSLALLAGALGLLLAASAILVMRGSRTSPLRERVRGVTGSNVVERMAVGPNIRVSAADERSLLQRLAMLLGYNPNLPPAYAASLPFIIAVCGTDGALTFWRADILFGSLAAAAAALLSMAAVARFLLRRKSRRYTALLFQQTPDALGLVVRAVRAGLPLGEALRSISREMPSPTREEFARVCGEAALGVPLEAAIANLHARTQVREHAFLAVVLSLHGQTGGNIAETLENLADLVRRRVAAAAKGLALSAEARASGAVLALLPFAVGGAITLLNPGFLAEALADRRGPNLVVAFVVMLACGLLSTRWIIQRSTQD